MHSPPLGRSEVINGRALASSVGSSTMTESPPRAVAPSSIGGRAFLFRRRLDAFDVLSEKPGIGSSRGGVVGKEKIFETVGNERLPFLLSSDYVRVAAKQDEFISTSNCTVTVAVLVKRGEAYERVSGRVAIQWERQTEEEAITSLVIYRDRTTRVEQ